MTESEAKTILERDLNCLKQNKALPDSIEAMELSINALEIVKQGGIGTDDACEWKLEDDNLMTGCGDYFNLYDNCTGKFKYCPRCGKKIKIVGD